MLAFMREQGHENPERDKGRLGGFSFSRKSQNEAGTPKDSSVQKPHDDKGKTPADGTADSGQAQEQEYLTVATKSKQVRKSTTLLAILFAVGLLCLLFMIKKSVPQTAMANVGAEETQVETIIARLIGVKSEMFSRMDQIVRKFYEFSDLQQVKSNELVKNPFKTDKFLGDLKGAPNSEGGGTGIDLELIRQQLRRQTESMQLLSIMQSNRGYCCMIDDKILYEGDSIGDFKVRRIGDNFVELESESLETDPNSDREYTGAQIVLKLSQ